MAHCLTISAALLCGTAIVSPLRAQSAPGATSATTNPNNSAGSPASATKDSGTSSVNSPVEVVTVTARKKAEKLQNVPLAITALSSQQLKAASATSLQDISFLTPGLTYNSNGQEANGSPVLRGLSDTSGGEATSQNVSIFLDGVYIANPSAIDLSLGGLDRVEIVKGPVSGLYGRNAFTGAINYVTAKPNNTVHTDEAVTLGSDGRRIGELSTSGPIVRDILAGRIAYTYDHLDGTFTDPVSGVDSNGHNRNDVLGSLLFTPDEHITITPVAYYGYDSFNAPTVVSYQQNCAFGTSNSYCGSLDQNRLGPFVPTSDGADTTGLTRRVQHFHVDSRLSYDFGTFDVLAGFNKIHTQSANEFTGTEFGLPYDLYAPGANNPFAGNTPLPGRSVLAKSFFGDVANESDSSVEARYDSPQRFPLRVGVGGYYYYHVATNANTFGIDNSNIPAGFVLNSIAQPYVTSRGMPGALLNASEQGTRDFSGVITGEYDILRTLTLSTAVRDTDEEQKQRTATLFQKKDFHNVTSNEALTWRPTPALTFYVSAANGAKSGGFNGGATDAADSTFAPETDWDYEAGAKTTLLNGHLVLNADVFHTDLTNLQVLGPPTDAGAVALVVKNFGDVSTTGFEISEDLAVGNGLKISSGFAYTDPRFGSGSNDFSDGASALIPSCASSRLITVAGQQAVNLKGLRPPFSSDETFNVTVEYRRPLPVIRDVDYFLRADYRFESGQYSTVTNFASFGSRNVLNLHAGLASKHWTLTGYVLNLTNDQTPVTSQFNASFNGFDPPGAGITWVPVSALPEGRTYAFRLAYHF
jgi:iron complex outermembrane receptor protein